MAMGLKKIKNNLQFYFFSLAVSGAGISGSDRIFIELSRNWSEKYPIEIYTNSEGKRLCKIQNLKGKFLKVAAISNEPFESLFLLNYLYKIISGILLGFKLKLTTNDQQPTTFLYSSSDFWMDSLPCFILKLRYPQVRWIATWYQTAPNPFRGFAEGERGSKYRLSAFEYWFSQLPIKPLIATFADKVVVNNEDEKKRFPKHTSRGDTIVLIGAVPLSDIKKFLSTSYQLPATKKYDAVFQGRFHPQKGVVELIDIWKKVVEKKPNAKLAMIGDGPLMEDVRGKIRDLGLEKNVKLFGYVFDGNEKFRIFASSKIVVHPAFYDSGGMASAEAMAFGLPCVGFNLKSYVSYYPKGMVKVKIGDLDSFANEIVRLLEDNKYRQTVADEALTMIKSNWSWDKRAKEVLEKIS